jgi:hypothetical protein
MTRKGGDFEGWRPGLAWLFCVEEWRHGIQFRSGFPNGLVPTHLLDKTWGELGVVVNMIDG